MTYPAIGLTAIGVYVVAGAIFTFGIVRIFKTQMPQWGTMWFGWGVWLVGLTLYLTYILT